MSNAIWAVNSALPIHNVKELVEYSKANPGKVSIGSWGAGTAGHAAQILLSKHYGADIMHVPYKGESQIMTDVIGGQVSMGLMSAMIVNAQMKTGKLRPIGVSGAGRSPVFPDLPTLAEQGFKQEAWSMDGPSALFGPQGLPPQVVATLGNAFAQAAKGPRMQTFAKESGLLVAGNTPEQAQAHFEQYFPIIKRVTQETGVVLD
jgi:tripartite-type tricarboxylate transporter receptor subunit TctC